MSFLISQNDENRVDFKDSARLVVDTLFDHFLTYRGGVSHQRYRPLKIGQLLAEVRLGIPLLGEMHSGNFCPISLRLTMPFAVSTLMANALPRGRPETSTRYLLRPPGLPRGEGETQ
jgi:hypothetical protein